MTEAVRQLIDAIERHNRSAERKIVFSTDEPMSSHTSFRIGGPADVFVTPPDRDSFAALWAMVKASGARACVLGNGSNVLFDDAGYRGAVIATTAMDAVRVDGERVFAEAGAPLSAVCKAARDASLTGLEFAYGIPGTVGGAVVMNAGAYDGEVAFVLEQSEAFDPSDGSVRTLSLAEHHYGYRESVYKHNGMIVLSAAFRLKPGSQEEIGAKMNDLIGRRVAKQPLEYPSAGSVFKRAPGRYTAQMIDECGLKGLTVGGAQISEKHAGFIVNRGGATSADVLSLIEHIRGTIRRAYGVELETEILYIH